MNGRSPGTIDFLLIAGIFMALACLARPYAELLLVLWAAAIVLFPDVRTEGKARAALQKLSRAALFIAPSILLIAPWVVRNALLWDCPTLSSVDRVTMRDYVAAKIISVDQGISLGDAQSSLQAQDPGNCPRDTAQYIQIVLSHPRTYAELQVAGTIPVLLGTSFDRWLQYVGINYTLPDLWGPFIEGGAAKAFQVLQEEDMKFPLEIAFMVLLIALQLLTYLVALIGLFSLRMIEDVTVRWWIIVLTFSILVLILAPGQGGNERFRVPVEPLLICLFAFGLQLGIVPLIGRIRVPSPVPAKHVRTQKTRPGPITHSPDNSPQSLDKYAWLCENSENEFSTAIGKRAPARCFTFSTWLK